MGSAAEEALVHAHKACHPICIQLLDDKADFCSLLLRVSLLQKTSSLIMGSLQHLQGNATLQQQLPNGALQNYPAFCTENLIPQIPQLLLFLQHGLIDKLSHEHSLFPLKPSSLTTFDDQASAVCPARAGGQTRQHDGGHEPS